MKSLRATDWRRVRDALDATGCAMLERILAPSDCEALIALYADGAAFRNRVVMAQHGFGRGEYKYLSYPLPPRVAELRAAL
ncbi:MAG: proline hydroxylase, partial [Rhizomicrobium sp.]